MSEVELVNFKASKRKSDAARYAALSAVELAARYAAKAAKREDINAQRRKRRATKRAASELLFSKTRDGEVETI
jgi:hypothetical protein